MNFRQALLCSLGIAAIAAVLVLDIRFCIYYGGVLTPFKYACFALLFLLIALTVYLFPVMAAFDDTIPHLLRNALFFASRNPVKMLLACAVHVIPIAVTVLDTRLRPLYGFLWTVCGFGLIAMLMAKLLLKDFERYLPKNTEEGEDAGGEGTAPQKSERERLKEMEKLDR